MTRRPSHRLYVGELVPDRRMRGQRVQSNKWMREEFLRVVAVELVAKAMIWRGMSQKAAIAEVARCRHRNPAALELLFKQNRDEAIKAVAALTTDPSAKMLARKLLERRRSARR